MILSSLKIGAIIYCSAFAKVGTYATIQIHNVPTKVQYVDQETGDIWIIHQFDKMNKKYITPLEDANNVKKHYSEGFLKNCKETK